MTISVVIPTYNRASFLPATLDAVLAQTLPPDEIIVVDDGSEDETQEVLRSYAPQVRHLRIPNSGELVARNTGVRAASGNLVAFCDSDDLWRPGFLAALAALWQVEPRTAVGYSDFVILRDGIWGEASKFAAAPPGFWDGLRVAGPDLAFFDRPIVDKLIAFQPFFPSCMMVSRDFFISVGGWDEAVNRIVGMDFATTLRMAEHVPFGVVRRPLVGIRKHAGGYSADVQKMNLGDSRVLRHVLATRPSLAPYAEQIRASIAARCRAALDTAFARSDFDAVRAIYAELPPAQQRSLIARAKFRVSMFPAWLRSPVSAALLRAGSLRARWS